MHRFTESQPTQTAISISILTTPCAIRDLSSVPYFAVPRTFHPHKRGNATKQSESRLFCGTITIRLPSSAAAKDRCRNNLPIYRPVALWCYPTCRAFRKGSVEYLIRQQQVNVAFKPLKTLNSFFPRPKAQKEVDRPQSGTVYKISCTNCSFVYYGQTERSLKTRIAEHKRAVSMFDHNSKISCHVHENNHEMNFGKCQSCWT